MNIPGRRGWSLGHPISGPDGTRAALSHNETGYHLWVWGETPEARIAAAQEQIDITYEARWTLMADLIDQGDFYGPNVRLLD